MVNIERHELPADDYESILVAFDDENGEGIEAESIDGYRLEQFIQNGTPIHYEAMFMTDRDPVRVVFWGFSEQRGWAERVEYAL